MADKAFFMGALHFSLTHDSHLFGKMIRKAGGREGGKLDDVSDHGTEASQAGQLGRQVPNR